MTTATQEVSAFGPDEAARRMGLGRTTVFHLVKTGELRSIKVGRRRLIPAVEITRFLGEAR